MDYQAIYEQLIQKAVNRERPEGYLERHHIKPKSLGGSNESSNIVPLTAREHFIAHLLLAKIYGGPMITAAFMLSKKIKTSRKYAWLREQFVDRIKGNKERGLKISKSLTGRPRTDDHVKNWKDSRAEGKGWQRTNEQNEKLSKATTGEKNPMYGKTHNVEARAIIAEANRQTIICPHCEKEGGIAIMKRWHYDNCKFAPLAKERKKYPILKCPHCDKEGGGAQMIAKHFDRCKLRAVEIPQNNQVGIDLF